MPKVHIIILCLGLIIAFSTPVGTSLAPAQEEENDNAIEVTVEVQTDADVDATEPEPVSEEEEQERIVVVAGDDFFDDFNNSSDSDDDDNGISVHVPGEGVGKLLGVIIICAIFFLSPAIFLGVILYYFYRRRRLAHETAFMLAEKGIEIPPALLRPQRNDLRNGILLITGGVGLTAFFMATIEGLWGLGLFPLFLGLGYIIVWKLGKNNK